MRVTSPFGQNSWDSGDFYAICDVCGFKYKRSELRLRWDKALVCEDDWEVRHPQESLRSRTDRIIGQGEKRPEQTDTFITTPVTQDDL